MTTIPKLNLDSVVQAKLEVVGAKRIPDASRRAINLDLLKACTALINEKITPDYVGDQTALGLKAEAANAAATGGGQ